MMKREMAEMWQRPTKINNVKNKKRLFDDFKQPFLFIIYNCTLFGTGRKCRNQVVAIPLGMEAINRLVYSDCG